eukprot:RCo045271
MLASLPSRAAPSTFFLVWSLWAAHMLHVLLRGQYPLYSLLPFRALDPLPPSSAARSLGFYVSSWCTPSSCHLRGFLGSHTCSLPLFPFCMILGIQLAYFLLCSGAPFCFVRFHAFPALFPLLDLPTCALSLETSSVRAGEWLVFFVELFLSYSSQLAFSLSLSLLHGGPRQNPLSCEGNSGLKKVHERNFPPSLVLPLNARAGRCSVFASYVQKKDLRSYRVNTPPA